MSGVIWQPELAVREGGGNGGNATDGFPGAANTGGGGGGNGGIKLMAATVVLE